MKKLTPQEAKIVRRHIDGPWDKPSPFPAIFIWLVMVALCVVLILAVSRA